MRNAHCVATGDPPFFINSSTIKAQCSPNHAMVYTENGNYTAVRRRAPHHCTLSPPEAMPLPNWGVLSAAPCSTHQLLAYANDVNILGGSIHTLKENAEALVAATMEIGLEVSADKT